MPDTKWISLVCSIYVVALFLPALAGAAAPDPDVLSWKFDEGTGTVAKDSSGKGHDGVITGAAWKSGGVGGLAYCLDFPGQITAMVEDKNAPSYLNGLGEITVALWIKSRVTNSDNGFINAEVPDGSDSFVTMRYDAAGGNGGGTNVLKMGVTSTSGEQQLETSSGLQTTEWQHVALTWKGGRCPQFLQQRETRQALERASPEHGNHLWLHHPDRRARRQGSGGQSRHGLEWADR